MHPLAQIHRDAAACGYVDARAARLPDGLHPRTLVRHLRRIGLKPWMRGFWVPGDGEPPYLVRCRIVLAVAGQALLTGASALWALGILRSQPDDVELLLPEARWLAPRPGVCLHYTAERGSIRSLTAQSLRITWVARALADHASHTAVSPLCRVIADAERLRHTTLAQISVSRASLSSIRHIHATLLHQAGVPVKVVSERLGHSTTRLTLDDSAIARAPRDGRRGRRALRRPARRGRPTFADLRSPTKRGTTPRPGLGRDPRRDLARRGGEQASKAGRARSNATRCSPTRSSRPSATRPRAWTCRPCPAQPRPRQP